MATKVNKKFTLVVAGFVVASVALLVGVIVVYNTYVKNAERNIAAGDALMAQGKMRDAYMAYGRAVMKKPEELRYIDKMESALKQTVATTATQAAEDYGMLLQLKNQRTRSQPRDPAQWKQLMDLMEDEALATTRRSDWGRILDKAKEMKGSMDPGSEGALMADMYAAVARAHGDDTLNARERADTIKALTELSTKLPKEPRVWQSLIAMQMADAERASRSGQANEAAQRMAQVDATLKSAEAALSGAGPQAAAVLARLKFVRFTADAKSGRRVAFKNLNPQELAALLDNVYKTSMESGDANAVRDGAATLAGAGQSKRALQMLDEWLAKHPEDVRSRVTSVLWRGQLALNDTAELDALRVAAKAVVDQPQLPTSLDARMQEAFRSSALSSLINAELSRIRELPTEERNKQLGDIAKLREQLLAAAQNQDSAAAVLAADAKIAHVKRDYPEAQKKWESFFAKNSGQLAPADAYLWAIATAKERQEFGQAMQYASKGSEVHPEEVRLVFERADLALRLGRLPEALGIFEDLQEAVPENEQVKRMVDGLRERLAAAAGAGTAQTSQLESIQKLVDAKQFDKAREIVDGVEKQNGPNVGIQYMRARIAMAEGNMALADQIVDEALKQNPNSIDLWKIKAERTTPERLKQIEIMLEGVYPDPVVRAAQRLNALRALRQDLVKREGQLRGPNPVEADKVKAQVDEVFAAIQKAETEAMAKAADDPSVVQNAFGEALGNYLRAVGENKQNDAQAAVARMQQLLEAARKIASAPELPFVLESTMLEAQGKNAEALALVEKARAAGRTEALLTIRLAHLRERIGNDAGALEAWEEAWKRRANDSNAVLGYARALIKAGKAPQAIDLLRAAKEAASSDARLALELAQLETVYGSRARAIEIREDLARRLLPIAENLNGLYSLYYMPPAYDALRSADGKPMTSSTWTGLTPEQRGRALSDKAREYSDKAERLYGIALATNPLDIGFAVYKARVMREQGRFDDGTKAIQDVIDAAKAKGKVPAGMYLDLGIHLLGSNRDDAAKAAFEEAKKLQDPVKREADATLAEIEVQRGNYAEAAARLEDYAKTNPRVDVQLRLCELYLGDNQFDKAQAALDKAKQMAGATMSTPMQAVFELRAAAVAAGRAEAADRAGNLEEGLKFRKQSLDLLAKADQLQPDVLTAAIRRVGVLRQQAKSGGKIDQTFYDQAVAEADKLLARNAALYEAAALRAGLALDRGDKQGAINVLDRFLTAMPVNDGARNRLIQLYLDTKNLSKAIALTRAAVDLAPARADWRERLGDLLSVNGDHTGAADAYERAFLVQPEAYMLLAKSMDERTLDGKPDVALVMQTNAGPAAQNAPAVRAAQAVALHKQNRTAESLAVAKEAITMARSAGINSADMQQVLPRLRSMYPPEKTQELEDLITSTGAPNTSEKVLIASMWGEMGEKYYDHLLKWADSAIADGDSVPKELRAIAHTARGNALYARKEMANAIKEYQAAAELSPNNATALNNAAFLAADADLDLEKCRDYAESAVALAPEAPEFLDTLGYVLTKIGKAKQDTKLLEYAEGVLLRVQMMTDAPSAPFHLGLVQAALGRTSDARKSYEKARKAADELKVKDPDLSKKIDEAIKALKN